MQKDSFVQIARVIGIGSLGTVLFLALFAPQSLWVAAPVVGALVLMGIALGYFASRGGSNSG